MRMAASLRTILVLGLKARSSPDAMMTTPRVVTHRAEVGSGILSRSSTQKSDKWCTVLFRHRSSAHTVAPKCRNELATPHESWSPYHIIGAMPRCASQQIADKCRRWVNFCRGISRNARLLYPTKLPRRPFAIEAVTGHERHFAPLRTAAKIVAW